MRLIKCHIINFGMLKDVDFVFNDNPFMIYKDNGEGKTTLLNFLLAMLYGLESSKARSKEESLRSIYYPYNGGLFGGSLEIENNNKIYRIERIFDKKSETKDEFNVFLNNKKVDIDIVRDIIHIDVDAFLKTLYFKNMDLDLSLPSSLTNQIISLDNASNMGEDYLAAYSSIAKLENNYTKNSENGVIKGLEKRIKDNLKRKLELTFDETHLLELKKDKEEKEHLLNELEIEKEKISSFEVFKTKEGLKISIQETIDKYKDKNKTILDKYGGEIISISDISSLRNLSSSYLKEVNNISNAHFKDEEEKEYLDLDYLFKIHPLTEEDIISIKEKEKLLEEINNKLTQDDSDFLEEDNEIYELFNLKELKEEEIAELDRTIEEYNSLISKVTTTHEIEASSSKKNHFYILFIVLTVLLLGGGIAFILTNNTLFSIIFFSLSPLSLLITFYLVYKNKKDNDNYSVIEDTLRMREIEENVHKLCTRYGIYSSSIIIDASTLKNKYSSYISIKSRYQNNQIEKEELNKQREEIISLIKKYRSYYHIDDINLSTVLNNKYQRYLSLKDKYTSFQSIIIDSKKMINDIQKEFKNIVDKYHLSLSLDDKDYDDKVNSYHNDVVTYNENSRFTEEREEELKQYIRETATIDLSSLRTKEEVNEDISNTKAALDTISSEIKVLEETKKELDIIERNIYEAEEKLKEAKEVARIYQLTLESLETTNNNIVSKYIDPIKNNFNRYAEMIHDVLGKEVHLSTSFVLEFKQNDSLRSVNHLSLGERTIASLVLRMAFIEELFKEEKPFLLLDDPFVDLDDNHLSKAIKLIKTISKDMQVIYITCHSSRKL